MCRVVARCTDRLKVLVLRLRRVFEKMTNLRSVTVAHQNFEGTARTIMPAMPDPLGQPDTRGLDVKPPSRLDCRIGRCWSSSYRIRISELFCNEEDAEAEHELAVSILSSVPDRQLHISQS